MRAGTLKIAWRNVGRNKRRTALAAGAIALGQLTLVFVNGLMAGWFDSMLRTLTGPLVGHVQIHHADWREERAMDLYIDGFDQVRSDIESIPGVQRVVPRVFGPVLAVPGEPTDRPADAEPGVVVGVDVAVERERGGLLASLDSATILDERSVALGKVLANRLAIQKGDRIAMIGQDVDGFPVSDLFEVRAVIDSAVDIVKTMGIVMPISTAQHLFVMEGRVHEIIVHGQDFAEAARLRDEIAALRPLAIAEVLSWREAIPELTRVIDMKWWFDFIFLGLVFFAAAAGIANTALVSTFERTQEFGMLLAVGSRPTRIVTMVLLESVGIGLVGVAVGSLIGAALVIITGHTGIDYAAISGSTAEDIAFSGISFSYIVCPRLEFRHIVYGLGAVTATSLIASLWPAVWAARLEPVKALRP